MEHCKVTSILLNLLSRFRYLQELHRKEAKCNYIATQHLLKSPQAFWLDHHPSTTLEEQHPSQTSTSKCLWLVLWLLLSGWWDWWPLWQPQRHTDTRRSPLTPPCFVVHTPVHNSLISQLHRSPARNVLLQPPACVCVYVCVKWEWLWTAGRASIWYTKNIITGRRAVWEIHTSQSQHAETWAQRKSGEPVILYLRTERTSCTPGTTHTNTATRRIK